MLTNTEKVLSVLMLFLVVSVAGSFFQTKSLTFKMLWIISFGTGSTWEAQNGPSCSQKWTFQTICGDFENFHF